ncbi:UNVERIFIED_CONTAM: IRK-interacting protein [Sesamum radiatum]|uniref:IRK-interacting protein n=1 Tax=Sesamum radiatum TaxID=300843 RepID=A0AAW2UMH0_SESRA
MGMILAGKMFKLPLPRRRSSELFSCSSPPALRFPSASPVSRHSPHLSAQDYPVFTPFSNLMKLIQYLQYKQSYDDEPLPGYQQILVENRNYGESWGEHAFDGGNVDETVLLDYRTPNASSRKGFPPDFMNCEVHVCPADDQVSVAGSCVNNSNIFGSSPGPDYFKRRRNSMGEIRSVSSCNKCRPAIISSEPDGLTKNGRKSNIVVPLTDSHSSLHSHPRNKGLNFSWLFPRLKKKNKNESSPVRSQAEEVPQMVKDSGTASVETLRKELTEANESRDAALNEVAEMKSSLEEFSQKLEYLETYCEELKKALRQAVQVKISLPAEKLINPPRRGKSIDGIAENSMPVSEEVMVEGFLQIRRILGQLDETDHTLVVCCFYNCQTPNTPKFYTIWRHHNQSLYQDFENCVFQKNGAQKLLDPQQDRQARFQSFVALRNLSWNEVLRKGTKFYSEEFSKYCDKKMSGIITTLGWTRPWSEQLLQAFFVAAKCIWLLHFQSAFGYSKSRRERSL